VEHMITPYVFLGGYGALGAAAAAFVVASGRGVAGYRPPLTAMLCVPLWPFIVPLLLTPLGTIAIRRGPRLRAIDEQATKLADALAASPSSVGASGDRRSLDAFVDGLRQQQRRLDELEEAMTTAPAAAREGLTAMRERAAGRLDEGFALLESLIAELTLLRFADLRDDAGQGQELVEDLLARMRALSAMEAGEA
jgi:hypothetical protein